MGWKLTKVEDVLVPVIAEREIKTAAMRIPVGYAPACNRSVRAILMIMKKSFKGVKL
jgi:hypothetical protein